jgi:hypothetical protein
MRVRESHPSGHQVLQFYGIPALQLIAQRELQSELWVITEYLSKVGTWRKLRRLNLHSAEDLPRAERESWFWSQAYPALDGAPEWLREAYLLTVAELIITKAVLHAGLRVSYRPKDLP